MQNPQAPQSRSLRSDAAGYIPELDSLRVLAVLSVMSLHWLPMNNPINKLQGEAVWGVYLFFVLSGFLITRILVRCRENIGRDGITAGFSLRQFYARRFLRIFPIYYFVVIVAAAMNVNGVRASLPWHVVYLSNFYFAFVKHGLVKVGPSGLFWTLSVEEQFYLLWPFAILLLPVKKIIPFVIAAVVIGTACHSWALVVDSEPLKILTPACVGFLASGALVAVCESSLCGSAEMRAKLLRIYLGISAGLAVATVAVKFGPHFSSRVGVQKALIHAFVALMFAWGVARASEGVGGWLGKILRFGPAVYLGRISYGLYVYHLFVKWSLDWVVPHTARYVRTSISEPILTNFGVRFLVTVAVASLSWFLLEKPLNDLKRYFPYSRKGRSLLLEERGIPLPATIAGGPEISAGGR